MFFDDMTPEEMAAEEAMDRMEAAAWKSEQAMIAAWEAECEARGEGEQEWEEGDEN